MKKSFFLGGIIAFLFIIIFNVKDIFPKSTFTEFPIEEQENILLRVNDEKITYEGLTEDGIADLDSKVDGVLQVYNSSTKTYVFLKNEENEDKLEILNNKDKYNINLKGRLEDLKLSPKGDFLYFKISNGDNVYSEILNIRENKLEDFSENLLISGNLVEFLDDGNLVLYGVEETKEESGIFTYDPKKKSYELIKKINGFIDYLSPLRDHEILLLFTDDNNKRLLEKINLISKKDEVLSENIEDIKDGEYYDNKFYFIGSKLENDVSIYYLDFKDNSVKAISFNFPKNIDIVAGIELLNGEIYFSGYENNNKESRLYKYNPKDGTIYLVADNTGMYSIIEKADKFWNLSAFSCLKIKK